MRQHAYVRELLPACLRLLRAASQLQQGLQRTCAASVPQRLASTLPDEQPKQPVTGRFYESVNVQQIQDGHQQGQYEVLLDGRPINTPGKHRLVLPSRALALAIAAEWEWQDGSRPKMHTMPLMSVAATAIDQPKPREQVIATLLKYVHTDATRCRVEHARVQARQAQVHDPLLAWASGHLGWSMEPSTSLFVPAPPPDTVAKVQRMLQDLDPFHLAAMEQLTAVCKSVVIAAALLHGRISAKEALAAARVEEDCQVEEWGEVEAGHDLDVADVRTRVYAPSVFLRLLGMR